MKVKSKGRIVSICISRNDGVVRWYGIELNPSLLFMTVTCVMTDRAEMAKNLEFGLNKQSTELFEKGIMRKNVKSV